MPPPRDRVDVSDSPSSDSNNNNNENHSNPNPNRVLRSRRSFENQDDSDDRSDSGPERAVFRKSSPNPRRRFTGRGGRGGRGGRRGRGRGSGRAGRSKSRNSGPAYVFRGAAIQRPRILGTASASSAYTPNYRVATPTYTDVYSMDHPALASTMNTHFSRPNRSSPAYQPQSARRNYSNRKAKASRHMSTGSAYSQSLTGRPQRAGNGRFGSSANNRPSRTSRPKNRGKTQVNNFYDNHNDFLAGTELSVEQFESYYTFNDAYQG